MRAAVKIAFTDQTSLDSVPRYIVHCFVMEDVKARETLRSGEVAAKSGVKRGIHEQMLCWTEA